MCFAHGNIRRANGLRLGRECRALLRSSQQLPRISHGIWSFQDVNFGSLDASEVDIEGNPEPSMRNIETTPTAAAREDEKFWLDMRLKSYGRSFFHTQKGYYGLRPRIIRQGDQCVVLAGATLSSTRYDKTKRWWKLVGECYLHGIMNREVITSCGSVGRKRLS